ncbi:MAG TPA: hypothetical protein P5513_08530 [Candidatus Diapherotrites archaeon]|nr:hypothetical protein [Candidatus Diapherotrites archaeon]
MRKKIKKYKLATNVIIIEKPKLEDDAFGWMICDGKTFTIEIKNNLSDSEKSLIFFHELCHFIQTISENRKENGKTIDEEKIAELVEQIVYLAVKKYPPLMRGLTAIQLEDEKKDDVKLVKSKKNKKLKLFL